MTLTEKRGQFLKETVEFYNSNNRCVGPNGGCQYLPTDKSPGCAIGRHLPLELAQSVPQGSAVENSAVFDRLPVSLKELGGDFLGNVQLLHDSPGHWDENGLTAYGIQIYNEIVKKFGLLVETKSA